MIAFYAQATYLKPYIYASFLHLYGPNLMVGVKPPTEQVFCFAVARQGGMTKRVSD